MDLSKISDEINNLLDSNKILLDEPSGETINVKTIEARENLIAQLSAIAATLPDLLARVESALMRAKTNHEHDVSMVGSILDKLKKTGKNPEGKNEAPWATVARKRNEPRSDAQITYAGAAQSSAHRPSICQNPAAPQPSTKYTKIKFTEALSLAAISVPTFDYVKQDGELYYVDSADHFAFKISGHTFHGNIGVVYTDEKNPEKIKDCKFADSCIKREKCDYYHDPVKFGGSKDYRNFIASAWLYVPPGSQYKSRQRSRRFGSREHLDTDIIGLQGEDVKRFHDQTMHDLLCSMLLNQSFAPS